MKTKHNQDPKFFSKIGKIGGEARKNFLGHDGYVELGSKGGQATASKHDRKFYQEIGRRGGKARQQKKK